MENTGLIADEIHTIKVEDLNTAGYSVYVVFYLVYLGILGFCCYDFDGSTAQMFFGSLAPKARGAKGQNPYMTVIVVLSILSLALNFSAITVLYTQREHFFYGTFLLLTWIFQSMHYIVMIGAVYTLYIRKHYWAIGTTILSGMFKLAGIVCLALTEHHENKEHDYRLVFGLEVTSVIWTVGYCTIYYALLSGLRWEGMMGMDA